MCRGVPMNAPTGVYQYIVHVGISGGGAGTPCPYGQSIMTSDSMTDPTRQPRPGQNMVDWLHGEVQSLKQTTAYLRQQAEQTQVAAVDVGDKLYMVEGRVEQVSAGLANLPQIFDTLGETKEEIARLREEQAALRALLDQVGRGWAVEFERDRRERAELYRRIETLERELQGNANRQNHVEEASRRVYDAVAGNVLQMEEVQRSIEAVERRVDRSIEAANRIDGTATLFAAAIDSLKNQDEVLTERIRLASEVTRRVEEDLVAIQQEQGLYHVILDKIELQRAERTRVDDRLAALEAGLDELQTRLESLAQVLGLLEGRGRGYGERLGLIQNDLEALREHIMEQLQKMAELQERLRRRRLEEIDRELKELKRYSIKLAEENGAGYGDGR